MRNAAEQRHAAAQQLCQPRLQSLEGGNQRAQFGAAAFDVRQFDHVAVEADPVYRAGKFFQRPDFPVHDEQRQKRNDAAEEAGKYAGRQAERRDQKRRHAFDDERAAILHADADLQRPPALPTEADRAGLRQWHGLLRDREGATAKRGGIALGQSLVRHSWRRDDRATARRRSG